MALKWPSSYDNLSRACAIKTAERIEILFGAETPEEQKKHCIE